MRIALVVAMLAGCSFPRPSQEFACTTTDDCDSGRVCEQGFCVLGDAAVDSTDAPAFVCTDWSSVPRHFTPCDIPLPTGGLTLDMPGVYTFDTDTATLTDPVGGTSMPASQTIPSGKLISVSGLTVASGSVLRVNGTIPLVVASWTDITISGTININSDATETGAGSNPSDCAVHAATPGADSGLGASGGGGGGFRGDGGDGGAGDGGGRGQGGTAIAAPLLLGGCAGANGGTGDAPGGAGGSGGGAIQLTARLAITITGTVHAGGAGGGLGMGAGGGDGGGGGGGGSGGMIGLEGATVTFGSGAILAANGGSGGQGGGNNDGGPGLAATPSAVGVIGGMGGDAGRGGNGSGGLVLNGNQGQNDLSEGGGGGGGSAGFIVITPAPTVDVTAIVSPAFEAPP